MTRFKDTGFNAPTDTRPSEHKGLKPPAITPQPKRGKIMTKAEKEAKAAIEAENKMIADDNLDFINDTINTETGEIQTAPPPKGVASTYLTDMYVSTCMVDIKAYREGGTHRNKLLDMHDDDNLQIGTILGTVSSIKRSTDKNDKAIIEMAGNFEIRRDDNTIVKGSQITLPTKAAGAIAGIVDSSPVNFEPSIFIEVFIKQYAQSPTGYTYIYKVQATAPEVSMFDDNPFLLPEK